MQLFLLLLFLFAVLFFMVGLRAVAGRTYVSNPGLASHTELCTRYTCACGRMYPVFYFCFLLVSGLARPRALRRAMPANDRRRLSSVRFLLYSRV